MGDRIRTKVDTSFLRERARLARLRDDWGDVAMFSSLASELDELRALATRAVDAHAPHHIEFDDEGRWVVDHPYACTYGATGGCEYARLATSPTAHAPRCAPGRYRLEIAPETGLAINIESHQEITRV